MSKQIDEETGLYYFNTRWYDAALGKFISEDPIKDGLNWYVYCGNNPLTKIDPTGLQMNDSLSEAGFDNPTEEELIEETLKFQNPILFQEEFGSVDGRYGIDYDKLYRTYLDYILNLVQIKMIDDMLNNLMPNHGKESDSNKTDKALWVEEDVNHYLDQDGYSLDREYVGQDILGIVDIFIGGGASPNEDAAGVLWMQLFKPIARLCYRYNSGRLYDSKVADLKNDREWYASNANQSAIILNSTWSSGPQTNGPGSTGAYITVDYVLDY